MSKWIKFLMTLVVGSAVPYLSAWDSHTAIQLDAGYRHDNLSWNFKAPNPDPAIASNLSFDDIHIFQIGLSGKTNLDCAYIRGSVSWGWVMDGDFNETLKSQISERNGLSSGPFQECEAVHNVLSASSSNVLDGRYVTDLSVAIGYPFYFCNCTFQFIPLVGYSYSEQNYRVCQNDQVYFDGSVASSVTDVARTIQFNNNKDCDYKFINRWWGPFIGIDLAYTPCDCWSLFAQFEAHWAHFKGIRETSVGFCPFDDFNRSSHEAHGYLVRVGANYDFCDCWYAGVNFTYQDWNAHTSSHVGDEAFENVQFTNADRFRTNVKLHSYAIGVSVGRRF